MHDDALALPHVEPWLCGTAEPRVMSREQRVRAVVDAHLDALWRFMRRLGVRPADLDDALQEVIVVFAARAHEVPAASERSFLFGTAFRVASESRRFRQGRREVDDDLLAELESAGPSAETLLDDAQARELLDRVLDTMPIELRAVFTLYEIEELTMAEVAQLLDIPPGTVASRLKRARESFERQVERLQASQAGPRRTA